MNHTLTIFRREEVLAQVFCHLSQPLDHDSSPIHVVFLESDLLHGYVRQSWMRNLRSRIYWSQLRVIMMRSAPSMVITTMVRLKIMGMTTTMTRTMTKRTTKIQMRINRSLVRTTLRHLETLIVILMMMMRVEGVEVQEVPEEVLREIQAMMVVQGVVLVGLVGHAVEIIILGLLS